MRKSTKRQAPSADERPASAPTPTNDATAAKPEPWTKAPESPLDSPYLTIEEGARYARFDATAPTCAERSFRQWLMRYNVPVARRGRTILVERRILDAYLRGDQWTKRRGD
jgi:hypothetical protein